MFGLDRGLEARYAIQSILFVCIVHFLEAVLNIYLSLFEVVNNKR